MLEFRSFVSYCSLLLSMCMILMHGNFPTKVCCADFSNETDMLALLAFKDRIITDDPLNVLSSWNHSLHFCQWKGITCGRRHQRVSVLNLSSQGLSGSVSPSIGNLSFLRIVDLSDNSFTGEVPQEISSLFRLQEFILESNSFGGHIPTNISSCHKMRVLSLFNNNFTGQIPANLGSLSKLLKLYFSRNDLTGIIPPSLGNLSALEKLFLSSNRLEGGIPESLGNLDRLTNIGVAGNKLSGFVPLSLYNLSYLATMNLAVNRFEGKLPCNLGHKHNLEGLALGLNQFSGTIPNSLFNASNIQLLDFGTNQFVGGVPTEIGNLEKLYWLSLSENNLGFGEINDLSFITSLTNCSLLSSLQIEENNFGGVLPISLTNLSTVLEKLFMQSNQISGNIPQGIGNLVNLDALAMYYNQFTGVIPETIGSLNKLQQVGFGKNNLSGRIPSSIGNLTLLSWLFIEQNNLEGSIPPSLGNCQKLELLHLYGNKLTGTIPREVIGLPSLSISLYLSQNYLSGPLPSEVGSLKNLAELDVSGNMLNGDIPSSLGACTSLVRLYMNDNSFGGRIPNSLSSLRAIEELDLSLNNLTGNLPISLGTLRLLQNLNLSFNDLEGEIPLNGVFTNVSAISLVGNRRLCGGIPDLHLPKCSTNELRKHKIPLFLKVIISVICTLLGLALVLSFMLIFWNKKVKKEPTTASSLVDPLMNLSYGDIFRATNGFSAVNLIGIGSFSSVYYGVLESNEQTVAVKVLNLQKEGATRSFIAECEALRNIKHRNLVKVITACSSIDYEGNEFKALVYEFMPNGSLETWLHPILVTSYAYQEEPRTLSLSKRLNIVIDIAAALDYLHNHCDAPIIHRDLKPSNILIDNDMVAHVSDFGLAKIMMECNDEVHLSQSSSSYIKGTIGYAAPEYGIGCIATTQGDVYSFGILVLEIFTGKRPTDNELVDGSNLHEMVKAALPSGVMEIVDCSLLSRGNRMEATTLKCLVALFEIGVACSEQSPSNRPNISDVANELKGIKDMLIKSRIERNL